MASVNPTRTVLAQRLITPLREWSPGMARFSGGRIEQVGPAQDFQEQPDFSGHLLIPGMIDLHINGAGGGDAAEGTEEALGRMSRTLARHGATGFVPTLITDGRERLRRALGRLANAVESQPTAGARALGIHLEGPFINPARKGAHPRQAIQAPSQEGFNEYFEAARNQLKILTLAPELPGALDLIAQARKQLPVVALGHSDADLETSREAIRRGANLAVHVFNAMTPLHHRKPGLLATVLNSDEIVAAVIADGIHVHPEMVRLLYRCKGGRRALLTTDAVSAAGMPDGRYQVGSVTIELAGGACRDADGVLAGSALQMDQGLRNLVRWWAQDSAAAMADLVYGASLLPARLLGLERKGRIEPGCDADLTLLDDRLQVVKTWVEGELAYDSEAG